MLTLGVCVCVHIHVFIYGTNTHIEIYDVFYESWDYQKKVK